LLQNYKKTGFAQNIFSETCFSFSEKQFDFYLVIRKHNNMRPFFLNQIEKYGIDIFGQA